MCENTATKTGRRRAGVWSDPPSHSTRPRGVCVYRRSQGLADTPSEDEESAALYVKDKESVALYAGPSTLSRRTTLIGRSSAPNNRPAAP